MGKYSMKVKKWYNAMALAKKEVCVGWLHENCYLVEGINLWLEGNKNLVGEFYWGRFFLEGGGFSKFSATRRINPMLKRSKLALQNPIQKEKRKGQILKKLKKL